MSVTADPGSDVLTLTEGNCELCTGGQKSCDSHKPTLVYLNQKSDFIFDVSR